MTNNNMYYKNGIPADNIIQQNIIFYNYDILADIWNDGPL